MKLFKTANIGISKNPFVKHRPSRLCKSTFYYVILTCKSLKVFVPQAPSCQTMTIGSKSPEECLWTEASLTCMEQAISILCRSWHPRQLASHKVPLMTASTIRVEAYSILVGVDKSELDKLWNSQPNAMSVTFQAFKLKENQKVDPTHLINQILKDLWLDRPDVASNNTPTKVRVTLHRHTESQPFDGHLSTTGLIS